MKVLNDDARSTSGFFEQKEKYHRSGNWNHKKLGTRKNKLLLRGMSLGDMDKKKKMAVLDPIEEKKNDDNEEGEDHNSHNNDSHDKSEKPIKQPNKSAKKEKEELSSNDELYNKEL